jgi:hypothetical protein
MRVMGWTSASTSGDLGSSNEAGILTSERDR